MMDLHHLATLPTSSRLESGSFIYLILLPKRTRLRATHEVNDCMHDPFSPILVFYCFDGVQGSTVCQQAMQKAKTIRRPAFAATR